MKTDHSNISTDIMELANVINKCIFNYIKDKTETKFNIIKTDDFSPLIPLRAIMVCYFNIIINTVSDVSILKDLKEEMIESFDILIKEFDGLRKDLNM